MTLLLADAQQICRAISLAARPAPHAARGRALVADAIISCISAPFTRALLELLKYPPAYLLTLATSARSIAEDFE
jgi:hypothetical protein